MKLLKYLSDAVVVLTVAIVLYLVWRNGIMATFYQLGYLWGEMLHAIGG